jgi:AcrR family transcriptional regulator
MPSVTTPRSFTVQANSGYRRRAATQQKIIDALHRLLESGSAMAALSVDRIAAEAGVSRSTFYLHFPDKRNLIARLAEQELEEWREISMPLLADAHAGRDVLEQIVREVVRAWHTHAAVVSGIIELSEYDREAREAWCAAVESTAETVAEHLRRRWQGRDRLADDAQTVARVIAWMVERVCHQMLREPDPRSEERVVSVLTEAIWRIVEPGAAS